MAMCNNSYMAVFYCFEQWLEGLQVSPNWRGILLSALFAMVLLWRPLASIVLLSRSKLPALLVTICLSSCIMLAYPFIHGPDSIWLILGLRIAQGRAAEAALPRSCGCASRPRAAPCRRISPPRPRPRW